MRKGNRQNCIVKILAVICAILLLPVSGFSGKVIAAEWTADLTVTWEGSGDTLNLYKVGDYVEYHNYDKSGTDFAQYPVDINVDDEKSLQAVALTLAGYVVRDGIKPLDTKETDDSGSYTWKDLDCGAYMLISDTTVRKGKVTTVPVFVYLDRDMEVEVKPDYSTLTECEVYKIWNDNDDEEGDRPEEIRVQLIAQDGTVVGEEYLSDDNNWYTKWTDLEEGKYKVVEVEEDIPEEYTVSVAQNGKVWKITNTYKNPSTSTKKKSSSSSTSKKIPQTGQLWWPVPLLASAGFICLIIGILRRRRSER